MCGISGLVNWGDREALERMVAIQTHRGPDDSGVWDTHLPNDGYVGLGSRRLSIIDLSEAGHMPMATDDDRYWITHNGEIYNFPELRQELEAKGHVFRSHTDTEVVLRLFQEMGPQCVHRLEGMFAFAIWDTQESSLFLARDHFGVKPLYYAQPDGRFAFASEAKALMEAPGLKAEVDPVALHQYLTFLWVPDPLTMFQGVKKLPAGHYAIFKEGRLEVTPYWDINFPPKGASYPMAEQDLISEVRERFRSSVRRQMISDVPLGAFLSAGLDSTSIVAMMAQETSAPVRTYTITFPSSYRVGESILDDPAVARRTAERFGCDHHEIEVEPQVADLLPDLVWHMDEPTADPAIIASYLVCREARGSATVMLSGVGGDEIFAGYRKHYAHYWAEAYRKVPSFVRKGLIEPGILSLPSMRGTPAKGLVRLAKKMARSGSLSSEDEFLMNSTYLTEGQKAELCTPALWEQVQDRDPWQQHREYFGRVADADFLNRMLYLDSKAFMPSLNLTYNDKMSMASSVEVRVPFLDRELVEFTARNVPPGLKLKGRVRPTTKYILRKAMEDVLPNEVLHQPKANFAAPVDYWLNQDLRPMVDDLLSESLVKRRGYFVPEAVTKLIGEHRSGRQDWSLQIWQLLTLELWLRAFVDKN